MANTHEITDLCALSPEETNRGKGWLQLMEITSSKLYGESIFYTF